MEVNKLREILNKNNGYITTKEIEENIVSKTYIPELLNKGIKDIKICIFHIIQHFICLD